MRSESSSSPSPSARFISSQRVNDDIVSHWVPNRPHMHGVVGTLSTRLDENGLEENSFADPARRHHISEDISNTTSSRPTDHRAIQGYLPGTNSLDLSELLPYYLPFLSWIKEYSLEYFWGDLAGGLSLATFQIPLAISYSTSLAKVPITCGLYSLAIAPLIYMVLGSVPQMITGPEAPMSLIVGQAVEPLLHHAKKNKVSATEYVVAISFVSGATLLGFGLGRFGFLDNILCDSLLKGFICGVGAVMIINSLIPSLGLEDLLENVLSERSERDFHSPFDKLRFVIENYRAAHSLTFRVSAICFLCMISIKYMKSSTVRDQRSYLKYVVYFPEILIMVSTTTYLCATYNWSQQGLKIVGEVAEVSADISLYNPLSASHLKLVRLLSTSGFVCAMLGFFESTTASKALGSKFDLPISSNRELVALGAMNLVCSIFGGLPAFGGYGRSKINAISARTTISGAIMGLVSLITARYTLALLHYIPKCVLSVITAVIGVSLIGEGPREVAFHWRSRGHSELMTFFTTVLTTIFFSIEAGISVGLIYSLIRVIKNSAGSNIQILGRVPGTNNFLDADLANDYDRNESSGHFVVTRPGNFEKRHSQLNLFTDSFRPLNVQALEEIEGCLIIKIPEPLTFTNASDLRSRLKRLELYGSAKAHPASKRIRDVSMSKYMIFDLEGMSFIDSSAAHLLYQSLLLYDERNIRSLFVRVSESKNLRDRLRNTGITRMLASDLKSLCPEVGDDEASLPKDTRVINENAHDVKALRRRASKKSPFFDHIRDALRVIDIYERRCTFGDDLSPTESNSRSQVR